MSRSTMLFSYLAVEDKAVLHPAVHALPVEGDHGVGRVPQDNRGRAYVVGEALDADEGRGRVGEEVADQLVGPDQRDRVTEVLVEKF